MNMRYVRLKNSRGETLDLTTTKLFFHDLSGLGYERNDSYRIIGNRWIRTNKQMSQSKMSGKILFNGESPYDEYFSFIQFCSSEYLILEYTPSKDTYYRKCHLSRCEKKELEKHGGLDCAVEFTPITPWFTSVTKVVKPNGFTGLGWVWGTTTEWPIPWSESHTMMLSIESNTDMESACRLVIHGPIVNPQWTVYSAGELSCTGKVDVTVPSECYLVIDNTNDPYEIAIYTDGSELLEDVYQKSDFSTDRFIDLKRGMNVINIYGDESEVVEVRAEGHLYYESV